jgi:hypothetical protein
MRAAPLLAAALTALLATSGAAVAQGSASKAGHKTGQYVGRTSEPAPVLLLVGKKRVTGVAVNGRADCTDLLTGDTRSFRLKQMVEASYFQQDRAWALDGNGLFDGTVRDPKQVRGQHALELRVKGKVKGRRVKGTVSYTLVLATKTCVFPQRRFTAKWTGRDQYGRGPSPSPGPRR